jgi:glycosyltransferase involved in cell wall biosynthesis
VKAAPSIAFHGYVYARTGYGTAARSYIHAFHEAKIDMSVISMDHYNPHPVLDPLVTSCLRRHNDPELHLCHSEPLDFHCLQNLFSRLIVLTTWEADQLPPSYVDSLNQAMEVWVPSRFNLEVFRRQLKVPVFLLPHPVRAVCPPCIETSEAERHLGLNADSFVFLSVGTWQERKNLPVVLEAFLRAFPDEPNARLILKTSFVFTDPSFVRAQVIEAIRRASVAHPREAIARILVCLGNWTDERMAVVARRANCYVSLSRGEGWCYPLFDAACNGTPVIATAYSGPMDYLDPRYHRLVRYDLTPAIQRNQTANFSFTPEMSWAEPDVMDAAALMRDVYEHRQQAVEQAKEGAILLQKKYAPEAVGRMARQRLSQLVEGFRLAVAG